MKPDTESSLVYRRLVERLKSTAPRPRIITPFFTSKEPGKGLGLGLAISQHVVTRAGGSIAVESMEGKGTTFRVQLPVSDEGEERETK